MAAARLLLALAAAALAARVPPPSTRDLSSWPITPEESARIEAEHERLCEPYGPFLERVAAKRMGYSKAPDPDAYLREWWDLLTSHQGGIDEILRLTNDHNDRAGTLEARLVARAFERAASGEAFNTSLSPELHFIQETNEVIKTRNGKVTGRWWEEGDRFREASEARAAALTRAAADRRTLLWACGGLAAALTLVILVKRRADSQPIVLAAPPGQAPALPAPQAVPALIGGNIDVVRPIGRGGMGEVYEGLDRTLQRRVALKRLRPELTGSPDDLSRLLKEARLVATLKHPNIVAIHSVEKEAGQVFLVFEYVDGPTLTTLLSQRRQLPWPEALKVFSGAAAALQAAHERNIVHRDLKPGNIMLDSKGVTKVMDFGIASEAAFAVSKLTRSGAWGTPPYMSPEQELGEVNTGVDLFALNVCLYEMLTGELPFTGPNFLAQKRERVYTPVSKAVPALPKALDAFFATAFDPDPVKRFHDAATLSAAAASLL
ncbi:serine/threonine protein kinase [bacterium]|nr:MAG: serine/threonine protein kinase [bacterium]